MTSDIRQCDTGVGFTTMKSGFRAAIAGDRVMGSRRYLRSCALASGGAVPDE